MQEVDQHDTSIQLSGRRKRRKLLYFITKRGWEWTNIMRKKSNIIVQKYIYNLAETQKYRFEWFKRRKWRGKRRGWWGCIQQYYG